MEQTIWTYHHRTIVHFGPGSLKLLPDVAAPHIGGKKIMLVTGSSGSMKKAGVTDKIIAMFGAGNIALFDRVPPNPTTATVHEGAEFHKKENCHLIIGLGGGSPIDAAKGIAAMCHNEGDVSDYFLRKKPWGPIAEPVIAVPTTSGTGTEVNANFVATLPDGKGKYGAGPLSTWPLAAVIDPELTLSLPQRQTASTGLDALSHAFEALWCTRNSPVTDVHSFESMYIIFKWLPIAYRDGGNIEARTNMSYSSMAASFAFGSTGTAAAHGLTYVLTTKWDLPHGLACAFVLPETLEFNLPTFSSERKERLFHAMGVSSESEAVAKLRDFCHSLETPARLADLGVAESDIPHLIAAANPFNVQNNKRQLTDNDIETIWRKKI